MQNRLWPRSIDQRREGFRDSWHGRISAIGRRYFRGRSMEYKEKKEKERERERRKACTRPSMHAHTLEYRQFRWFRVADGLFECLVACAREYCRSSYAKLSRVSTIQCILRAHFARRLRFLNGKWPAAMCRSGLLIKSFKRFSSLWTSMQEKKRGKKREKEKRCTKCRIDRFWSYSSYWRKGSLKRRDIDDDFGKISTLPQLRFFPVLSDANRGPCFPAKSRRVRFFDKDVSSSRIIIERRGFTGTTKGRNRKIVHFYPWLDEPAAARCSDGREKRSTLAPVRQERPACVTPNESV